MTGFYLALTIPELLLGIFEHLSADGFIVAALVCKAWSAPAVDTRWRTQVVPLSNLLAKLAPVNKNYGGIYAVIAPQTHITQDHWNRFLEHYANRITKLYLNEQFDIGSLRFLSSLLGKFGGPFCNNLNSLNWPPNRVHNTENHRELFDLLHATKLQTVRLGEDDTAPTGTILLSQLAHRATHIREIVAPEQFNSFNFSAFPQLRSLSYRGRLSAPDFYNLACCLHLRLLHLENMRVQVATIHDNGVAVFPYLEEFRVDPSNDAADNMIMRSVMPALRSLEYRRYDMGPRTVPLLNGMIRTSPHLESISLTIGVSLSQLDLVRHDGVRNLFFNNWSEVRSELGAKRLDLPIIARTFPKLETLYIRGHGTLKWLQTFASCLPHLRHLRLSLHVAISQLHGTSKEIAQIQSLTSLKFDVLSIRSVDIDRFINYLIKLCPNVRNMQVDCLWKLIEVKGGRRLARVDGNGPAFVKRFFLLQRMRAFGI
ncbi:hypothetical protein FRB93_002767 [Tulasnella sp. JGI-2019a]|nr:hypothetical protein FRB93_002767 [Tulasnella sp. JGI-2019a]